MTLYTLPAVSLDARMDLKFNVDLLLFSVSVASRSGVALKKSLPSPIPIGFFFHRMSFNIIFRMHFLFFEKGINTHVAQDGLTLCVIKDNLEFPTLLSLLLRLQACDTMFRFYVVQGIETRVS